jgi:hypothetical protein
MIMTADSKPFYSSVQDSNLPYFNQSSKLGVLAIRNSGRIPVKDYVFYTY